ncbi:MAG: hypothetical protein ABI565_12370 [Vicinamibacteria bacterium]
MIALALGLGLTVISAETAPASPASWSCAYVAARLPRSLGLLGDDTVSAEEMRAAKLRLSLSATVLTRASNLSLARDLAASRLIVVRCLEVGPETRIEAQDFDAERPVAGSLVTTTRPRLEIAAAIDEIARRLASSPRPGALDGYRAPTGPSLARAGAALALEGAGDRARGLTSALHNDPTCIDLRLSAVEALIAAHDYDPAIRLGKPPLSTDTPATLARGLRFQVGAALLEAGRYPEAAEAFDALRRGRETAAVLNNLGVARFRLRDPTATALFERAGALPDPRQNDIAFNRTLALIFQGEADSALPSISRLMEATPNDARVRLLRAWALRLLNREAERAEEWDRLLAQSPSFASLAAPDLARRLERIFFSERNAELGAGSSW